jgi:post-segregation antitoxin (ccd killing protein)
MSKRVNISMPEELYADVKKYNLNTSKVCQKALETAIRFEKGKRRHRQSMIDNAHHIIKALQRA